MKMLLREFKNLKKSRQPKVVSAEMLRGKDNSEIRCYDFSTAAQQHSSTAAQQHSSTAH
jgi:hypothetical protein